MITACSTGSPKWVSARCLSARSTWAETSGGVTARSPMRMLTTSACGVTSKGRRGSSSFTSS